MKSILEIVITEVQESANVLSESDTKRELARAGKWLKGPHKVVEMDCILAQTGSLHHLLLARHCIDINTT